MTRIVQLSSGADARLANEAAPLAVIFVNGGSARAVPGTWSATSELLATELIPRFPELAFVEVRYRLKTWNALDSCMADGRAALDLVARPSLLVGFSMGGAVSIGIASHPDVTGVLGLAPWIPERLSLEGLRGKRFDVAPRLLGSLPARDPRRQRRELADRASSGCRRSASRAPTRSFPVASTGPAIRRRSGKIQRLPRGSGFGVACVEQHRRARSRPRVR